MISEEEFNKLFQDVQTKDYFTPTAEEPTHYVANITQPSKGNPGGSFSLARIGHEKKPVQ